VPAVVTEVVVTQVDVSVYIRRSSASLETLSAAEAHQVAISSEIPQVAFAQGSISGLRCPLADLHSRCRYNFMYYVL
jgi:hypothetical protein